MSAVTECASESLADVASCVVNSVLPSALTSMVIDYAAKTDDEKEWHHLQQSVVQKLRANVENQSVAGSECSNDNSCSSSSSEPRPNSRGRALLTQFLSHPSFPRHRCSHLLILLENDTLSEEEKKQPYGYVDTHDELPTQVARGAPLEHCLRPHQRQQWEKMLASGLVQSSSETISSVAPDTAPGFSLDSPLAASLCVARIECQQLDIPLDSQCQRFIVSTVSWSPKEAATHSSAASSSHQDSSAVDVLPSFTDFASIAWPDMDYLAYDPLPRGRVRVAKGNEAFPLPTANQLVADIFPFKGRPEGPHCYSRIGGPLYDEVAERESRHDEENDKNSGCTISNNTISKSAASRLSPPDSAYLLDATGILQRFHRFKCEGRADHGGALLEYYHVRHCIGVMIRLPPSPPIVTVADAQVVRQHLNQLKATMTGPQCPYERNDYPPQCPSFGFASMTLHTDLQIVQDAISELRIQAGLAPEVEAEGQQGVGEQ